MIKRFGKYIRGGKKISHSFYIRVHKRENYNSDQSDFDFLASVNFACDPGAGISI